MEGGREGGAEGGEEDKGRRRKNDISILRPVLPVSGLISQRLWGAECDQSVRLSSSSSLHLQPEPANPKAGGSGDGGWGWEGMEVGGGGGGGGRNITGKLVLD